MGLNQHLLDGIEKLGYPNPTFVQEYAIPSILQGRDVITYSQGGGSGKNIACLIALLHKLLENKTESERYVTLGLKMFEGGPMFVN